MALVIEQTDFHSFCEVFAKEMNYISYDNTSQFWEQLVAEYYRWFICNTTEQGNPVHINRILSVVRTTLGPFVYRRTFKDVQVVPYSGIDSNADEGDIFSRTLSRLETIRDIAHLGAGYYAPTPLRTVKTPMGRVMFVGGLPTKEIEKTLDQKIKVNGVIRTTDFASYTDNTVQKCFNQSFEDWSSISSAPLKTWIKKFLKKVERELVETSITGNFEIYDPSTSVKSTQYFRWADSNNWDGKEDSIWLCRTKHQPRRYWMAVLRKTRGGLICYKEANISNQTVRKLQYGIDLLYGCSCTTVIKDYGEEFGLKLFNYLPDAEMRLLYGLGNDKSKRPDRLPMEFTFHKDVFEDICSAIRNLGITMRRE